MSLAFTERVTYEPNFLYVGHSAYNFLSCLNFFLWDFIYGFVCECNNDKLLWDNPMEARVPLVDCSSRNAMGLSPRDELTDNSYSQLGSFVLFLPHPFISFQFFLLPDRIPLNAPVNLFEAKMALARIIFFRISTFSF